MIEEDLVAEQMIIESCREMVAYLEGRDAASRRILQSLMAFKEKHAVEMAGMLNNLHLSVGKQTVSLSAAM